MTPEQIAEKHYPIHTTCHFKIQKLKYQRLELIKDINNLIDDIKRADKPEVSKTA